MRWHNLLMPVMNAS